MTVLLESRELIVRGDIRERVSLHTLEQVTAHDDILEFFAAGERIELAIGAQVARRWADAIVASPPTLVQKLGITPTTRLHLTGLIDDDELSAAIAHASEVDLHVGAADLAIVRTDSRAELARWIATAASDGTVPPTWIVYTKGRGAPLGESGVREAMIPSGFIDTKVAAVSKRLTALRFNQRQR